VYKKELLITCEKSVNNISIASTQSRVNNCSACRGTGFEMRWMMQHKCRACDGTKKRMDENVEVSAAPEGIFEPLVLKRRGRPKKLDNTNASSL
jgi:DnaJ-class molecular chaperone